MSSASAAGAAVFSAPAPAAGAAVLAKPAWVSVMSDDTAPLISASIKVNGVSAYTQVSYPVGHWQWDDETESDNFVVDDYTIAKVQSYKNSWAMINGTNNVAVTVVSASGVSTYNWTFDYVTGTTISTVTPTPGAVLPSSPASITASLVSPYTAFTSSMKIDGVVVPTVYNAATKTFTHTPATALTPGSHTVVFTASAAAGSATRTWSFTVRPPMSTGGDCASCHSAYAASHPRVGCEKCHDKAYAPVGKHGGVVPTVAGCMGDDVDNGVAECHQFDHSGNMGNGLPGFACTKCHSESYPAILQHTDTETTAKHVSTTTGFCIDCHSTALVDEHAKYPSSSAIKYQCDVCHGTAARPAVKSTIAAGSTKCDDCHAQSHVAQHSNTTTACAGAGCHNATNLIEGHTTPGCSCHTSTDPVVVAAIAAKDKACDSCHNPMAIHGAVHEASPTFEGEVGVPRWTGSGTGVSGSLPLKCLSCHRTNLLSNHGSDYTNCSLCHAAGGPRASFTDWDKTCMTGDCHPSAAEGYNLAPHPAPTGRPMDHQVVADGVQPDGYCQSCHGNPVGQQCGAAFGCHAGAVTPSTSVDFTPPTTVASMNGTDPVVWNLVPTDAGDGVTATYYSFDGEAFKLYGDAERLNGITNPADEVEPYAHTLRYYSTDAANNVEAIKTKPYNVTDFTAPVVSFSGARFPSGSSAATSTTMFVADPIVKGRNTGVASIHIEFVTFYFVFGNWTMAPYPVYQPYDVSYPKDASWDQTRTITGLEAIAQSKNSGNWVAYAGNGSNGRYMIKYTTTDYTGNVSEPVMTTLYIDNAVPVTTVSTPTAGEYRWKLTTTDSSPFTTYYSFDGAPFTEYSSADASSGIVNTQPGGTNLGAHTLRYYAEDGLGHVESIKTHSYSIIETTPPVASLSETMTSSSIFINASDPEGPVQRSGVKSIVGRVYQGATTKSITTTFAAGDPAAVRSLEVTVSADGTWTLDYYVYDWDGNRTWYYQSFKRDTTPPTSSLGGWWNTTWQLYGSDAGIGVAATYYSFDGAPYQQAEYITWFAAPVTPQSAKTTYGTHTLSYYSVDKYGFTETPKTTSWVIPDTTKPTITMVPVDMWSNTARLDARDTDTVPSGVKEIRYRVKDGEWVVVPFVQSGSPTATVSTDIVGMPDGSVKVDYYVVDVAGNASVTKTNYVYVDKTAPVVSVTQQSTNADGSAVVRVVASDATRGVDRGWYEYTDGLGIRRTGTLTGVTPVVLTVAPPASGTAEGSVSAYARDWMGNESTPVTLTVTLTVPADETKPVTSANVQEGDRLSSTDGVWVFGVYPSDNRSGVATTHYKIDDGEWQTVASTSEILVTVTGYGTHTFSYYSVDNAGNVEDTQSRTFEIIELATLNFDMTNVVYNANWKSFDYAYAVELYDGNNNLEDVWSGQTWADGEPADTIIKLPAYDAPQPWTVVLTLYTLGGSDLEYTWYNVEPEAGQIVDLFGTYSESWDGVEGAAPTTIADAVPYYSVAAEQATIITLTPADTGGSGVATTYYELDGAAALTGTVISVPAPALGAEAHTLRFWSVDNAGNVEDAQTVLFTVETI